MKRLFILILFLFFISSCAPVIQGGHAKYWTGQGWYHPNKTDQEVWQDINQCQAQSMTARGDANQTLVEIYCMQGKGYIWK